jgi:UDP-glucose 4-epimerase
MSYDSCMSQHEQIAVVTGGAGFIGSHIVEGLIHAGHEVHAIDNLVAGKRENVHKDAFLHVCDVRDLGSLPPIFKGATYVFHLAALPRVQFSLDHPIESNEVNVSGTLNVLTAAKEARVKRVIYAASSSVYGDQTVFPLNEELPALPSSPYGLQKYIGERYMRLFSDAYGFSTVSLRYFNVYGSRMDPMGPYALVVGKFLQMRKEGKPLTITGDGKQTRDFTHVRDVVRANLLAATSPSVGHGEVVNIGAGRNVTVNRIAELIGGPVAHIPKRLEPHDTLADISRAKKLLKWEPTVELEAGIAELKKRMGFIVTRRSRKQFVPTTENSSLHFYFLGLYCTYVTR